MHNQLCSLQKGFSCFAKYKLETHSSVFLAVSCIMCANSQVP